MSWANKTIFFILCAAVVLTTMLYGAVHQPVLALFYLGAAVIGVLWAIDAFSVGTLRFNKNLIQIPLAAAFLYGIFQIIPFGGAAETAGVSGIARTISREPYATQISAFHFLALLIYFAAFLAFIDGSKRLRKIVLLITIFGFVYAFYAILQSVLSPNKIYGIYEVRFASPFGSFVNRHNFAAFVEMAVAVPLGMIFVGAVPKDRRLLYITAIALMGVALLLSGSRGGLVSFLGEIFFLIILTTETRSYGQYVLKFGLMLLLAATIIVGASFVGGESSLSRFAETAASQDITTNRAYIWSVALEVIKNSFPLGAGLGAFGTAFTPFDTTNGLARVEQAHNDYLQILADAGIVGLMIGAFFVFQLFRNGLRNARTENLFRRGVAVGALAGCFAVFIHSIFDFVLHTTAIALMFLLLSALVVVSGRENADDIETPPKRRRKSSSTGSVTPIESKRVVKDRKEISANKI